jgi:hypothetical protein
MSTFEPRTATVVIFGGDYLDRIRLLEQKAEAAKDAEGGTPRRVGTTPEYLRLAKEHDDLVKEAEESALRVVVQALRRSEWKALVKEHPPRVGNKDDERVGANEDTFKDALIPVSIVEPAGFGEDDLDALSDADFDRIYYTAFSLNRGVAAGPKAGLYSRMSQESEETSN